MDIITQLEQELEASRHEAHALDGMICVTVNGIGTVVGIELADDIPLRHTRREFEAAVVEAVAHATAIAGDAAYERSRALTTTGQPFADAVPAWVLGEGL